MGSKTQWTLFPCSLSKVVNKGRHVNLCCLTALDDRGFFKMTTLCWTAALKHWNDRQTAVSTMYEKRGSRKIAVSVAPYIKMLVDSKKWASQHLLQTDLRQRNHQLHAVNQVASKLWPNGINIITLRSLINVQSLITVQGVKLFYKKFKVSSGLGLFPFLRP